MTSKALHPQRYQPAQEWIGPVAGVQHLVRMIGDRRDSVTDCGLTVRLDWIPDLTGTGMHCDKCSKTSNLSNDEVMKRTWVKYE